MATAAPAAAATSNGPAALVVTQASYYVQAGVKGGRTVYWLVPGLTVTNPTDQDPDGVTLTLHFPVTGFTGVVPTSPPSPYFNSIGNLPGAIDATVNTTFSTDHVDVSIMRFSGPPPGTASAPGTITIGSFAAWSTDRGALGWLNNPTATVSYTLQAGLSRVFGAINGAMPLVTAPTS
jgi:hypothetical protein